MKTVKNIPALLALCFLLTVSVAHAQGHRGMHDRKEMAEKRFKELSDRLQLRPDQQAKVKEIAANQRSEMRRLREEKKDATRDEKREVMKQQLKKTDASINALLDPKQQELYKQYKEEKKMKMKEMKEDRDMMQEDNMF